MAHLIFDEILILQNKKSTQKKVVYYFDLHSLASVNFVMGNFGTLFNHNRHKRLTDLWKGLKILTKSFVQV